MSSDSVLIDVLIEAAAALWTLAEIFAGGALALAAHTVVWTVKAVAAIVSILIAITPTLVEFVVTATTTGLSWTVWALQLALGAVLVVFCWVISMVPPLTSAVAKILLATVEIATFTLWTGLSCAWTLMRLIGCGIWWLAGAAGNLVVWAVESGLVLWIVKVVATYVVVSEILNLLRACVRGRRGGGSCVGSAKRLLVAMAAYACPDVTTVLALGVAVVAYTRLSELGFGCAGCKRVPRRGRPVPIRSHSLALTDAASASASASAATSRGAPAGAAAGGPSTDSCAARASTLDSDVDSDGEATAASKPVVEECCVCLEDMVVGRSTGTGRGAGAHVAVSALPCGHKFHTGCVRTWLAASASCPLCRASVRGGASALRVA